VTKNVLAVVPDENSTIDWLNHYMTLPLGRPLQVQAGDVIGVGFAYRAGGSLPSLEASIEVEVLYDSVTQSLTERGEAVLAVAA
jgi:hypothetical protein